MKTKLFTIILLLATLSISCKKDKDKPGTEPEDVIVIDCATLSEGLILNEREKVKSVINPLCEKFLPMPTTDDPLGHAQNLDSIIVLLNDQCEDFFEAKLHCYACLESLPPQSLILIYLDSIDSEILLKVPENGVMYM